MGRDMIVPPHYRPLPGRPPARTHFSSPHQSVSTNQTSRGRSGGTMIVPPPPSERTHQSTQTPQANTSSSANTQPQPPASKHAHNKPQQVRPQANTRNVPTPTRVGTPSVSAGTRVLAEATGMKQSRRNPHKGGHAGQAHTRRARKQPWFAPKRCRPAPARRG